jgi:ribosomal protein S18 acetylase RimI-like enzyme
VSFFWRQMTAQDLDAVDSVATVVHRDFPEDRAIFEERLRLHPSGCLVLEQDGEVHGYLVSHPWRGGDIPKLNRLLRSLPTNPQAYYLHDIALLPSARGHGAARHAVDIITQHAAAMGLRTISLCSVNNAAPFWESVGFDAVGPESPVKVSKKYGVKAQFMCRYL